MTAPTLVVSVTSSSIPSATFSGLGEGGRCVNAIDPLSTFRENFRGGAILEIWRQVWGDIFYHYTLARTNTGPFTSAIHAHYLFADLSNPVFKMNERTSSLIASMLSWTIAVSANSGQIQLTRTLSVSARSLKLLLNPTTPCLVAQYTGETGIATIPVQIIMIVGLTPC